MFHNLRAAKRASVSRLFGDVSGQMSIILAIAAIPLIGVAGLAIDYQRATSAASELQGLADSASLAAAASTNLSGSPVQQRTARAQHAKTFLDIAFQGIEGAEIIGEPEVTVNESTVKVTIHARVEGSFIKVLSALPGHESDDMDSTITINSTANYAARFACLLALNPTASDALSLQGRAGLAASNCNIQVNSTSAESMSTKGRSAVSAMKICTSGNYTGSGFTPVPKTNCNPMPDPYAASFKADFDAVYPSAPVQSSTRLQLPSGTTPLQPGIYAGGIRASSGSTAELSPGTYFMRDGTLEIRSGGTIKGSGVTIVFVGSNASFLDLSGGGNIEIKAPASAPFAGMAIASHPDVNPTKDNKVTGGGTVSLEGVIYFPKQTLAISGNGNISVGTKQFSMVADKFSIHGTGDLNISQGADYAGAGLPPLATRPNDVTPVSLAK
jgi:Flp pilus assembly protein TadG